MGGQWSNDLGKQQINESLPLPPSPPCLIDDLPGRWKPDVLCPGIVEMYAQVFGSKYDGYA